MNKYEAKTAAIEEMKKWNLTGWAFAFNNRLTRALGRCCYTKRLIELSTSYVEDNTLETIMDTIRHEIAHALAGPSHGHDEVWKRWCRTVGCRPEATVSSHQISVSYKYQLAFVEADVVRKKYEVYSMRKQSLANRMMKGMPETLNKLVWLPLNNIK
jgi:predicted SprT family Zn-dependent metalloprotease